DMVSACVGASTALPTASTAAASPRRSAARLRSPNVPPPAAAQIAPPRLPRTSPAPASSPADETSPAWLARSHVPHCDASALWLLPPDPAPTPASPAGNSHPPDSRHPLPSILCSSLAPALPLDTVPSGSSLFSPPGLLPRPPIRGHFYRGEKGTLSSRFNPAQGLGLTKRNPVARAVALRSEKENIDAPVFLLAHEVCWRL